MTFIDQVKITVRAGDGGAGAMTFGRQKGRPNGPANGGDGGSGGDVVLRGDARLRTLLEFRFRPLHRAQVGGRGASSRKRGKNAPTLVLPVPLGTIVHRLVGDDSEFLGEIIAEGEELLVAAGGLSGKGNARFVTPARPRPDFTLAPTPGDEVELRLELKLLADVGLLGCPNAGKSTLMASLSNARPEVGAYPFTTKAPSLGLLRWQGRDLVIADLPGLIEGASLGLGLGHQFLKHLERVSALAHLVTLPAHVEGDPLASLIHDFEVIEGELERYGRELARRPRLAILSQTDRPAVAAVAADFQAWCQGRAILCLPLSCHRNEGIEALKEALLNLVPGAAEAEAGFDPLS